MWHCQFLGLGGRGGRTGGAGAGAAIARCLLDLLRVVREWCVALRTRDESPTGCGNEASMWKNRRKALRVLLEGIVRRSWSSCYVDSDSPLMTGSLLYR